MQYKPLLFNGLKTLDLKTEILIAIEKTNYIYLLSLQNEDKPRYTYRPVCFGNFVTCM